MTNAIDQETASGRHRPKRAKTVWTAAVSLLAALVFSGCAASESTATPSTSETAAASSTTSEETITDTAAAAEEFMAALSDEQHEQLVHAYDDESKTTTWSNFPVTFVSRVGLNLDDLNDEQRAAAMKVLEALLSEEGYETATGIMGGDEFLLEQSSSTEDSLGQYYIAFFGDPSATEAWQVQFGGHHLGMNATLDGSDGSITFAPTHLGLQPAVYTDDEGNEVQPLAGMYETAFAFYDSLTDEQEAELYQGSDVGNLACAPGGTCSYPTGTGIAGSDLTDEQKQLLLDVIANWVGLSDEETTAQALAAIEATLDETYVNWSGATEYDMSQGDGVYFQISGPNAYVEFSNQQGSAGADVDGYTTSGWGHIHTVYRDPANDYAGSVTQQESSGMGGPGGGAPPGEAPSGGPGSGEAPFGDSEGGPAENG
ncbi:DUF3500 domain-containing protein [Actinorugispora endophytica]|uniref:Uncharacterized protein DUF3500 n=1 Tax=Actinorugispora endophytica TaxID=1605990 RepID=A0A4R6UYZ2_9ACTN|nr:DUF3500 domain-containing protein [Actinorugispora endophytica]TDQ51546.1 uncharacterized protein DUF3500 [Actinorugispora endophytica]